MKSDNEYMAIAIALAKKGMNSNKGGPFGAIVVDAEGDIIGRGCNEVTSTNDPTAHAEVTAIRRACKKLSSYQLDGCTIYTSCEPCPMCLGAIYWARPARIVFACGREDAAHIGFDDNHIYDEIPRATNDRTIPTMQLMRKEGIELFEEWDEKNDKTLY